MFSRKKSFVPDMRKEATFLDSILGEYLVKLIKSNGGFLAGGCIRSIFSNQPINDFDVFFPNQESYDNVYKELSDSKSIKMYKLICATTRASTFEPKESTYNPRADSNRPHDVYGPSFLVEGNKQIQLVCCEFNGVLDTLNRFDFRCCMGAYDFEQFHFDPSFFIDNSRKILTFNPDCMLPLSSLYRMNKFLSKGYTITDESLLLLTLKINQLKMDTYEDLRLGLKKIPLNNASKNILMSNSLHDWKNKDFCGKTVDIEEVSNWLYSDSSFQVPGYVNQRAEEHILNEIEKSDSVDEKEIGWNIMAPPKV